jgi:hypothetical protein
MTGKVTPAGDNIAPGAAAGSHSLSEAVGELHKQHPYKWNDLGPHHGGDDHHRHHPVSGSVYKSSTGR